MKLILSRRGEGRTKACVNYLRQHPKVLMVVHSQEHANYARRMFTRNESHIADRIQTWEWVMDEANRAPHRFTGMVIDDVDYLLSHILDMKIDAVSMEWPCATEKEKTPTGTWWFLKNIP